MAIRSVLPDSSLMWQYLVLNEPWRAVDEMRAVAEAIFKFGFVSWSNGNAVGHDEHDRSSCSQYLYHYTRYSVDRGESVSSNMV
jgi:hypothetical protein